MLNNKTVRPAHDAYSSLNTFIICMSIITIKI